MRVDQKELARVLGINRITVSRALNNSPRVSEEMKQRVREVCDELGYKPNFLAKSLVSRQTKTISVLCTGLPMNDIHNRWVGELQGRAFERGYKLRLDIGSSLAELIAEGSADGFIVIGSRNEVESAKIRMSMESIPAIFIDFAHDESMKNYVVTDNVGGGTMAVDYLVSLGHRRIAFFGLVDEGVCPHRYAGYEMGLVKNGLSVSPEMTVRMDHWPWLVEETYRYEQALYRAMALGATAVVTSSDIGAVGCIKLLKSKGMSVPKDVSVLGYDDTILTRSYDPRITCIRQDIIQASRAAVDMLLKIIGQREPADGIVIPNTLSIRESTGPVVSQG